MSAKIHDQHVSRLPGRVIQIGVVLLVAGTAGPWLLSPRGMSTSGPLSTLIGLLGAATGIGLALVLIGLLGVVMRDVQREQTNRVLTRLDQLNRPPAGDQGDVPPSDGVVARTPTRSQGSKSATSDDDSRWRPPKALDR